jgi:cytoplasmic iron level regulating protein YaaA (DUF328/UPF0246 family)
MIFILSPAKNLQMEGGAQTKALTNPDRMDQSQQLINKLRKYSAPQIADLMKLSEKLATLNRDRYKQWSTDFNDEETRASILAFRGDVYRGIDADQLSAADLKWAQKKVRILSGLHGLLKPLDRIRPYRLEMGTKLPIQKHKNLYEFWGDDLAAELNALLKKEKDPVLVNLASAEYFKAAQPKLIEHRILTCEFWDFKNGQYKPIQTYLKRARGYMTRYAIQNRIEKAEDLKGFDLEGYSYSDNDSEENRWIFVRG